MSYQIDNLTIHRFRGLRNVELSGLGRINLIVGPNNSGKTTVLEAVSTFCQPLDVWAWLGAASWNREVPPQGVSMPERTRWLFPNDMGMSRGEFGDAEYGTRVSGAGRCPILEVRALGEEITQFTNGTDHSSPSSTAPPLPSAAIRSGHGLRLYVEPSAAMHFGPEIQSFGPVTQYFELWEGEAFVVRGPTNKRFSIPTEWVNVLSHHVRFQTAAWLGQAFVERRKDSALEMIRHFDPGIRDVELVTSGGSTGVYVDHEQLSRPAPLMTFGSGLQRLLDMALAVEAAAGGALLIDELEIGIHRDALGRVFPRLVEACKLRDVQLFATTHSLEAIDAILPPDEADCGEIVAFRLGQKDGRPFAKRTAGDMLHDLRYGGGLDVR